MGKTIVDSANGFLGLMGQCLGTSGWMTINQEQINAFADATRDHQWIHVDPQRAKSESYYGATIAHGYLTVSLIPSFLDEIVEVRNLQQLVNYSIKEMTFKKAVKVGSKLRMTAYLKTAKDLGNICQATMTCIFEVEGMEEPVLEGNIIYLYYFKNDQIV